MTLTLLRVPITGAGYVAAYQNRPGWVVALALAAVATDILDGIAARRLKVESEFGANVDSVVDFGFYVSVLLWTVHFTPELLDLGPLIGVFAGAYLLLFLGGLVLARRVAVHNRMSRLAATVATTEGLYFVAFDHYRPIFLLPVVVILVLDIAQRAMVLGKHLRWGTAG